MTLHEWQTSLVELVNAHASKAGTRVVELPSSLSTAERQWLDSVPDAAGFRLTCGMQRWWRQFRLRTAAPLTLAGLGPDRGPHLLDAFLDACPRKSMFIASEALRFLDFVAQRTRDVPHLADVIAFERAMVRLAEPVSPKADEAAAKEPLPPPGAMLSAHPLAALVAFAAPPEEVLGALLAGRPMPAVGPREHWLLFAPCFPRGARGASAAEARLFEAIRSGRWIVQADPDTSAALAELWAAGAVVRSDTGH